MDRDGLLETYMQLIERVVSIYFANEEDTLVLKFFRMVPGFICSSVARGNIETTGQIIDKLQNSSYFIEESYGMEKILQDFQAENPAFILTPETVVKIKRFLLAAQTEEIAIMPSSDSQKLSLLLALRSHITERISLEQDDYFKQEIQYLITHLDIYIDRLKPASLIVFTQLRFIPQLNRDIISRIAERLEIKGIIHKPELLVQLFTGEDIQIEVADGKYPHYFYLYRKVLYRKVVLLSRGKGYLNYMAAHISDFSKSLKKSSVSQYLHNQPPLNPQQIKVIADFIRELIP